VERCYLLHIDDGGPRWHRAAESRRPMRVDGLVQEDGVIWRHGDIDGGTGKVDASVPALKMDRWKTAAATSESAPNWCVPQTRQCGLVGASGFRC
jgi:hypothetical protein